MDERGADRIIVNHLVSQYGVDCIVQPEWLPYVHRMRQNHISHFPTFLLAKLLSFTSNRDIFSIIQVCRKWYAASQLCHFWEPRIEQMLLKKYPYFKNRFLPLLAQMDNFGIVGESIKSQCRWIVRADCLFIVHNKSLFEFQRPMDDGKRTLKYKIENNVITSYSIRPCRVLGIYGISGEEHLYRNQPYGVFYVCIPWKSDTIIEGVSIIIEYRGEDEFIWYGECAIATKYDWDTAKPHGKGKWTFPNGDTLSGDSVAYDGTPHGIGVDQEGKQVEYFAGERLRRACNKKMHI